MTLLAGERRSHSTVLEKEPHQHSSALAEMPRDGCDAPTLIKTAVPSLHQSGKKLVYCSLAATSEAQHGGAIQLITREPKLVSHCIGVDSQKMDTG